MQVEPDDDTDPVDVAALRRALAQLRALQPSRCGQLDAMTQERGWQTAARFAAYSLQISSMGLKPWQVPPCAVRDETDPRDGEEEAAALLTRMLDMGLSQYEWDPLRALEAAEAATETSRSPRSSSPIP
jgi:hypothetical protein